jgi:TonB family protein
MRATTQHKAYVLSIGLHLLGASIVSLLVLDAVPQNNAPPPIKIRIIPQKEVQKEVPQPQTALLPESKIRTPTENSPSPAKPKFAQPATLLKRTTLPLQMAAIEIAQFSPQNPVVQEPSQRHKMEIHARHSSALPKDFQATPLQQPAENFAVTVQKISLIQTSRLRTSAKVSPQSATVRVPLSKTPSKTKIHVASNRPDFKNIANKIIPLETHDADFEAPITKAVEARFSGVIQESNDSPRYGDIKAIEFEERFDTGVDTISPSHQVVDSEQREIKKIASSIVALSDSKLDPLEQGIVSATDPMDENSSGPNSQASRQIVSASLDSEGMNTPATETSASSSQGESVDFGQLKGEFTQQIRNQIANNQDYPPIARKRLYEGQPVVAFTLAKNGAIINLSLHESSSYSLLDSAALSAVRKATPYPPIPELLGLESMTFLLPILFSLK